MTVAGLLALALEEVLGLSRGYWAVLTAVIVTQASVGGSIKATVDRLIGTVSGALWGGLIAIAIPHTSPAAGLLAVGLALAPLTLMSALSPSFRIAPVTAMILLLTPAVAHAGVLTSAIDRILEIILGSVIGLVCSLVVLPARAGHLVAEAAASTAALLAELLRLELAAPDQMPSGVRIQTLQDQTRAALSRMETVVGEAKHERRTYLATPLDPAPLLRTLLRLRHDLVMLRRALTEPLPPGDIVGRLQPRLNALGQVCGDFLLDAGAALRGGRPAPDMAVAQAALDAYSDEVDGLRRDHLTRDLPSDAVERLFTLGFALDQLGRDLGDLSARAAERAATPV